MVELKLEALDNIDAAKETFVAVRVGEVQKLSRLSSAKDYKFPQAAVGDRKFGRVDVFRRVGSASIGLWNSSDKERKEEVAVEIKGEPSMNFRVSLGAQADALERRRAEAEKAIAVEQNAKVQDAKQYLLEHNLEDRLSEALQAVLQQKPEDPAAFIFGVLRKSSGDFNGSPPKSSASGLRPADPVPTATAGTAEPAPIAVEDLRAQAKETLLKASRDGALETALKEAIVVAGSDEETRQAAMIPVSTLYGSQFASSGVSPGFVVQ